MTASVLLDSGSGVIAISEGMCTRLRQYFPGMELRESYPGGQTVTFADGHVIELTSVTLPIDLAVMSAWGDISVTLPFFLVWGRTSWWQLGQKRYEKIYRSTHCFN